MLELLAESPAIFIAIAFAFALLIVPSVLLSQSLLDGAQHFAAQLEGGNLHVPPPPDKVAEWPVIGSRVFEFWMLASQNLAEALDRTLGELSKLSSKKLLAGRWAKYEAIGAWQDA